MIQNEILSIKNNNKEMYNTNKLVIKYIKNVNLNNINKLTNNDINRIQFIINNMLELGLPINSKHYKRLGDGISELKFVTSKRQIRFYCHLIGHTIFVLLITEKKSKSQQQKDIKIAKELNKNKFWLL
ncbi:MAG: type II toxin-antitoxin system RelE/ParE family toxin [Deltaproteobacteria bacterium]|jgi:phage-related protein|nr:type II toxin-antitoxin system RelE/ParE family toxin [Deltaproteobacteria bacterium]